MLARAWRPVRVRWWLLAALAAAAPGSPAAAPALRGAEPALRARPTSRPAAESSPDTILARVGPRRRVSVADFRHAWGALEPPQRPDTLTPQTARQFLDLLIGKEALAERAVRERWVWTRRESLRHEALRDRLVLRGALEPHLERARADLRREGRPADDAAAGVAARDRYVAGLSPAFDDSLLTRLAAAFRAIPRPSADSGLFAQLRTLGIMPMVGAGDSLRLLATTTQGPFRVSDLIGWWRNLSPVLRPRVESPDQLRDIACNALFETELRRQAAAARLAERADIALALALEREGYAVEHFVEREVYRDLPRDSATLRRYFDRDPSRWALPLRVRVVRLELGSRAEAERMGARLLDRAQVETLIGEPLPEGPLPNSATPPDARFVHDLIERDEPRMFRAALAAGPGMVIGPDSTTGGWTVARVVGVIPARLRGFEAARSFVDHEWFAEEGERRIRALIERVRRSQRVRVNARALRGLTSP